MENRGNRGFSKPGGLWAVSGCTRIGAEHRRVGLPNQDAVGWVVDVGRNLAVCAVADGHGAPSHPRSDRGARFAAAAALKTLAVTGSADDLPSTLVASWRTRVIADMAADPVVAPPVSGATLAPYGSTLIAAAVRDTTLLLVQIGDGDLVLLGTDGDGALAFAPDAGLARNQTYSLCMDDAVDHVRVAQIDLGGAEAPVAVALVTDGVTNSFTDRTGMIAALHALATEGRKEFDAMARTLPDRLEAMTRHGTGDDASLCLMLAPDLAERNYRADP